MSYILEALKKAQAERQLGALPTIHAAPFQAGLPGVASAPARKPLWLALSVLALLALLLWRQPWRSTAPAVAAAAPFAVPVLIAASAPPAAPVPAAKVPAAAPRAAPLAAAPVPATPVPDARPAPPLQATAKPMAPAADDGVLNLRDLPEPIQRQIPPLALGGYIYSRNPADRLLLIDKVLRHEGEEVAPGLTLEKLESKAAVFSFKGYRYRSPY